MILKSIFLNIFLVYSFAGCCQKENSKLSNPPSSLLDTTTVIPICDTNFIEYREIHKARKLLKLSTNRNTSDSPEITFWFIYAFSEINQVIHYGKSETDWVEENISYELDLADTSINGKLVRYETTKAAVSNKSFINEILSIILSGRIDYKRRESAIDGDYVFVEINKSNKCNYLVIDMPERNKSGNLAGYKLNAFIFELMKKNNLFR